MAHHVGRRAQRHPALGLGPASPLRDRGRVEAQASLRTSATSSPSPMASIRSGLPASSASTIARSSRRKQAVSRATSVAFHSVICPARKAAKVSGS